MNRDDLEHPYDAHSVDSESVALPDASVDLEALKAQHSRGHGPCGCTAPARCVSARYLAIIERLAGELAEAKRSAAGWHGMAQDFVQIALADKS